MWPLILAYVVIACATAMAWVFVVGGFAIGIGFGAVGLVKIARKKWWTGIVCALLSLASILFAYAYYAGMLVL